MLSEQYFSVLEKVEQKILLVGRSLEEVKVVAVSKFQTLEAIRELYQLGCQNFGESRVQEGLPKIIQLMYQPNWHFIGTLQTNKVAKVVKYFDLVHSVDSIQLAKKISEVSLEQEKITPILLQVNISLESTKHGLTENEWEKHFDELHEMQGLEVQGLMTMAPLTTNEKMIRMCFRRLYELRIKWRNFMKNPAVFHQLSMGMSNDYLIAIEEGATLLRIGSAIFN